MATKLSNKTNTRLNLFTKEGLSALRRCKSVCNSRGVPTGSPSGSDREHSDDPGLGNSMSDSYLCFVRETFHYIKWLTSVFI